MRNLHVKKKMNARILLAALLMLAACDVSSANVKKGDSDYPEPNPDPNKLMVIHGTIDSALEVIFTIKWVASNESCRFYVSRFEGAIAPYHISEPLALERNAENFSVKVPIDGVLKGRCGWKFDGIDISGQSDYGHTTLVATNTDASVLALLGQSPNGVINLRCEQEMGRWPPVDVPQLHCRWFEPEARNASVRDGVLWWRPETTDVEVHISRGTCKLAWCTASD